MASSPDWQGIALVITASGTFLTALATAWVAVRVEKTHALVNGMSKKKEEADYAVGHADGKVAGSTEERADPHILPAAPTPPTV